MTRYATGRETPAQLRGSSNGTTVPVLKPAFSALRSNTSFPGLAASSTGLLLGVELTIDWLGLSAAGRIQVANPMSVAITVDAADFDVQVQRHAGGHGQPHAGAANHGARQRHHHHRARSTCTWCCRGWTWWRSTRCCAKTRLP
jgi:hypothetical protein